MLWITGPATVVASTVPQPPFLSNPILTRRSMHQEACQDLSRTNYVLRECFDLHKVYRELLEVLPSGKKEKRNDNQKSKMSDEGKVRWKTAPNDK